MPLLLDVLQECPARQPNRTLHASKRMLGNHGVGKPASSRIPRLSIAVDSILLQQCRYAALKQSTTESALLVPGLATFAILMLQRVKARQSWSSPSPCLPPIRQDL
ncbi:hypothetical protein H0G86_009342 [Trichoderma simmonsii]|uniref:Uncharacterized protein n=1 Tax=Trichoderma simmonsii TaxID=1491479 RepID=A0A8G0LMD1_9HYPO|nr:hypothetical protein H0G86_009342 [Trichoderma simmonsii]